MSSNKMFWGKLRSSKTAKQEGSRNRGRETGGFDCKPTNSQKKQEAATKEH